MILEAALRAAGPDAHLVATRRGVLHVYTGPLGAGVPQCRTRAHWLTEVHLPRGWSSLAPDKPSTARLCARCSASLTSRLGEAEQPRSREEYKTAFARLTPFDLVLAARAAVDLEELDQVAHLSLVLFDHTGCMQPVERPDGHLVKPLHHQLIRHRTRLGGFPDMAAQAERHDALSAAAAEQSRRERKADRQQRERAYQAGRAPRVPAKGATQ